MTYRSAKPDDWGYILSTFIKSYRENSTHAEGLSGRQIAHMLTSLAGKDSWCVDVVEEHGLIAMWDAYCGSKNLAWIYVRPMFRGQGWAKSRCLASRKVYTPFMPNRNPRFKATGRILGLQPICRPFMWMPDVND